MYGIYTLHCPHTWKSSRINLGKPLLILWSIHKPFTNNGGVWLASKSQRFTKQNHCPRGSFGGFKFFWRKKKRKEAAIKLVIIIHISISTNNGKWNKIQWAHRHTLAARCSHNGHSTAWITQQHVYYLSSLTNEVCFSSLYYTPLHHPLTCCGSNLSTKKYIMKTFLWVCSKIYFLLS